jgi:hypothetical protein
MPRKKVRLLCMSHHCRFRVHLKRSPFHILVLCTRFVSLVLLVYLCTSFTMSHVLCSVSALTYVRQSALSPRFVTASRVVPCSINVYVCASPQRAMCFVACESISTYIRQFAMRTLLPLYLYVDLATFLHLKYTRLRVSLPQRRSSGIEIGNRIQSKIPIWRGPLSQIWESVGLQPS